MIGSDQLRQPEMEGLTAWEIVDLVRPQWLRSRGSLSFAGPAEQAAIDRGDASPRYPFAKVVVDAVPYGDLTQLRSLRGSEIEQISYLNSSDATTRFGTGYEGGAVVVVTRMRAETGGRALRSGPAAEITFASRPGERVRVTATGSWTGVVQASGSDSISILVDGSGERRSIGWASVDRLEVSAGRKSRWKGAQVGAGVGGALGFVAGFILDEGGLAHCRILNAHCDSIGPWRLARDTGAGMLGGAVVGALVHRGERWRAAVIPAQLGFAITGDGSMAVALRIPYGPLSGGALAGQP